jgi:hypothetical protein
MSQVFRIPSKRHRNPLRAIEFVELIIGERIRLVLAHCFSLENDHPLECPSDAESDYILPLWDDVAFTPGVVGEYQPERDVDHRHLDAEFQP